MRESVEIDHPAGCGLSKGGTDRKKKKKKVTNHKTDYPSVVSWSM